MRTSTLGVGQLQSEIRLIGIQKHNRPVGIRIPIDNLFLVYVTDTTVVSLIFDAMDTAVVYYPQVSRTRSTRAHQGMSYSNVV